MTKGSPNSNSWAQQSTEAAFMTAVSLLQLLLVAVEGFGSVELFIRSVEMFELEGLQSLNTLLSPFLLLSIGLAPPADGGTLLKVLRHRNSLPTTRSSLSSPLSLSLWTTKPTQINVCDLRKYWKGHNKLWHIWQELLNNALQWLHKCKKSFHAQDLGDSLKSGIFTVRLTVRGGGQPPRPWP